MLSGLTKCWTGNEPHTYNSKMAYIAIFWDKNWKLYVAQFIELLRSLAKGLTDNMGLSVGHWMKHSNLLLFDLSYIL